MSASRSRPAPAFSDASSASPSLNQRAKSLGVRHDSNLRVAATPATAPAQNAVRESADESSAHDSCNLRAAEWLVAVREESGLTVEQAAAEARVSPTTVWRRENALVDLGPLKQLVAIHRARGVKAK